MLKQEFQNSSRPLKPRSHTALYHFFSFNCLQLPITPTLALSIGAILTVDILSVTHVKNPIVQVAGTNTASASAKKKRGFKRLTDTFTNLLMSTLEVTTDAVRPRTRGTFERESCS